MKVLITGSSRGIGRAVALKFLSQGHQVIGFDIKEDSIELINNSNNWGFGGVDCGIAMLHLELGAEFRGVFGEWKFKDGAPVFIPLPQSANCHDESEAYDEEDAYNDEFRYEGSSSADDAADSDIPNVEVESSYNFNIG